MYSSDEKGIFILIIGFVKIWDVSKEGDKALVKTFRAHKERINAMLVIEHYVVTASDDKKINVADIKNDCESFKFEGHTKEVVSLEFKAEL